MIPLEIKVFAAVGLLGASFLGGYHLKDRLDQAKEAKIQAEISQHLQEAEARNASLQQQLDQANNHVQIVTQTVIRKVPYVINHYIEKPGAPVTVRPMYYFTVADVSLWNAALDLPMPSTASRTAQDLARTYSLSPVTIEDAFSNHALNSGQYLQCLNTVRGWQEWWQGVSKLAGKAK